MSPLLGTPVRASVAAAASGSLSHIVVTLNARRDSIAIASHPMPLARDTTLYLFPSVVSLVLGALVEGCIVREGSVLGMGVFIGQSTKIVDRETGEVMYGEVPPYSVVVAGSMPSKNNINLYCAVIVKRVDAKTRSKTGINELLRD